MLVQNFQTTCFEYTNFEIWEVDSTATFFAASPSLPQAFEHIYQMPLPELQERRNEIEETELEIMEKVLDHIGDKFFYVFTYHSDNHAVMVHLQEHSVMSYGLDINEIREDRVYICIMDKKPAAH